MTDRTPGKRFVFQNHPPLGAHTSISGGVFNALYNGQKIGCDVIQLFSKNQMQWKAKPLLEEEVDRFHRAVEETGVYPMTIHDAYLINLASPNEKTFALSFDTFADELKRCELLDVPYLVMHPGAHMNEGEEAGMNKIAASIRRAWEQSGVTKPVVLLETTAGQGTNVGYSFEQLDYIIQKSELGENIGVCVDTCHVFAAGYDIRTAAGWKKTKSAFDQTVGLNKLKAFHINDSKRELGSRVDRHQRIGKGELGIGAFRAILNDSDLQDIPMIMEIPGGDVAYAEDLVILRSLKD